MADGQTTMQAFTTATFGQNGQIILSGDGGLGGLQGTCKLHLIYIYIFLCRLFLGHEFTQVKYSRRFKYMLNIF